MAVKNGEEYIKKTIESILNQTYKNFEFLIIVNCSTDNTLNIIKEFQDERIRVYTTDIPQLGFNLNYGLNLAKGDFIVRIDADDIAANKRIEKQLAIMEKNNIDVIGSNIRFIDSKDNLIGTKKFPQNDNKIRKLIFIKSVLAHPTVMFKKSVVINIGGYLGGKASEDYNLWLRLMKNKSIKFYNIQKPLLDYRIHENQVTGTNNSFPEVAGHLFTESIKQKNILYFIGSFRYLFSSFINQIIAFVNDC